MDNTKKQIFIFIIFFIIDVLIAYTITGFLGIKNIIITQTFSSMGDMTYEILICLSLLLIEFSILDYIKQKKKA